MSHRNQFENEQLAIYKLINAEGELFAIYCTASLKKSLDTLFLQYLLHLHFWKI